MQSGKKNWVFSFVFFTNSIKVVCLLIVTVTIKYFEFFTKMYHCFAIIHRNK